MNVGKELYWHEGSGRNLRCDFASIKQSLGKQETIRCALCVHAHALGTEQGQQPVIMDSLIFCSKWESLKLPCITSLAKKGNVWPGIWFNSLFFNDDQSCLHTLLSNFYMWNIFSLVSLPFFCSFVIYPKGVSSFPFSRCCFTFTLSTQKCGRAENNTSHY